MKKYLPKIFQSADSRFHLRTSLIIASIPIVPLMFLGFMIWVSMNTTFNFLKANGLKEADLFEDAFFDYIMLDVSQYLPYIALFFVALFFVGNYLAHLALRPFKKIGLHSRLSEETIDTPWEVDTITSKKIVCEFAEIFFNYLYIARSKNDFTKAQIDRRFEKVMGPVADKVFYFHYFTFVSVISVVFIFGIHLLSMQLHEGFVNFALEITQNKNQSLSNFLLSQEILFESVTYVSIGLVLSLYMYVSRNLIASVDGVSYHFFRVMREIMGGNVNARVRLRVNDPGQQSAVHFNELLDHVLTPNKVASSEAMEEDLPPPLPLSALARAS